ncbi:phage head morphogenesis protein [Litorisediminicola beolgyonensis]|uniref:Phage minor head protein n=1 Tax=Litorisediminicola beolgyonensis TaxID=1173614 RepID=A0ABW3ZI91_9RHOB
MADIAATLRRPFPEQIAAFRARLGDLVPTARWDDIRRSAHDRAFMVAGATKADLLADLAAAVDRSISEGLGIETFRAEFRRIVDARGWHGWTGEGPRAGEAWRTRVIYRTNMRTSYAAGRMAQLREAGFPLWVYRHGGSLEPRLEHLGWDGLVLPVDHPFWATHAPPNGWGCSCYILGARNLAHARRLGGRMFEAPEGWEKISPRTGAPVGIDKGWDYAPGATVTDTILALRKKLDELPPRPSIDLIQSWLVSDVFKTWFAAPRGLSPLVRLPEEAAARIGAQRRVADLSAESALKQARAHPELTPADYALAQLTVDDPTHTVQDSPLSLVFIRDADDGHLLVVKATRSGQGLFVTSFRRMSARAVERQRLIDRLLRRE